MPGRWLMSGSREQRGQACGDPLPYVTGVTLRDLGHGGEGPLAQTLETRS